MAEVNRGSVSTKDRLHQLKSLQDGEKMREYLASVRQMDGYGSVVFPHCASDARREGHVVPIVGFDALRLQACKQDGELEEQIIEFAWETITQFEVGTNKNLLRSRNRPHKIEKNQLNLFSRSILNNNHINIPNTFFWRKKRER